MEDNKLIKSSVDVSKIIDNQYVEKARESLNKERKILMPKGKEVL